MIDLNLILQTQNKREVAKTAIEKYVKFSEESGELAECLLKDAGLLNHKILKEETIGEIADVYICLIDVLTSCYPCTEEFYDIEQYQKYLSEMLNKIVSKKVEKWKSINQL